MAEITLEQVVDSLKSLDFVDPTTLDPSIDLSEQDLDSLDVIQTLFEIQEAFDIEIEEESIANKEWSNLNKIVEQLNKVKNG